MARQRRVRASSKRAAIIFGILFIVIAASVLLYIYSRTFAKANRMGLPLTKFAFDSIMTRALPALIGMSISGFLIAVMSQAFQTATESRILTPSMIGFDSVFVGTQTLIVFLFGAGSKIFSNGYINYLISAGVMVIISMLMYGMILRKNRSNLVFLLMFGLVLSGIIRSGASYLQLIMNANDYMQIQAATAVTVNNMNTRIIYPVAPIMAITGLAIILRHKTYDVIALGRVNAKNLGVNYDREINVNLLLISIGMSVTTALIGSLAFLGLLAVNIAREIFKTHRHSILFIGAGLFAVVALIFGQATVELLQAAVPITTIIDLLGCSYMFYLILKENKKV
ncbi:MAG: iron chelate uptake ABC transporter family permease subunit [Clostridiales bacterium]|jgi:iron complex transport system permease protein|nr:iron chelate uptake ABC transporter family permease subunit [Clostridiales bacterium]